MNIKKNSLFITLFCLLFMNYSKAMEAPQSRKEESKPAQGMFSRWWNSLQGTEKKPVEFKIEDIVYKTGTRNYKGRIENKERKTIEAYDKDEAIGYITYGAADPKGYLKNQQCRIAVVEVDSEYRRKGIGQELVRRAMEDMQRCWEIDLGASNTNSIKFFKKQGAHFETDEICIGDHCVANMLIPQDKPAKQDINDRIAKFLSDY